MFENTQEKRSNGARVLECSQMPVVLRLLYLFIKRLAAMFQKKEERKEEQQPLQQP